MRCPKGGKPLRWRGRLRLINLGEDWRLPVWETGSGHLLFVFAAPVGVNAENAGGCFDSLSERFAFAARHEACLLDLATGLVRRRWRLANGLCDQLQFDPADRLLLLRREEASAEPHRSVWRLFELAALAEPVLLREQTETNWLAANMAFTAGGTRFLAWESWGTGSHRSIHGYDTASGQELWLGHAPPVRGNLRLCIDPFGRTFAFASQGATEPLRLMDSLRFTPLGTVPGAYSALSPLAQGFASEGWLFLDPARPAKGIPFAAELTADYVSAFSPDGRFLAWATPEGALALADLPELRCRVAELGK